MTHEFSNEEIKDIFLKTIWNNIKRIKKSDVSEEEKLINLAFSMLSTLDGSNIWIPQFVLAPLPNPDDKEFMINRGCNYFPENHLLEEKIKWNISWTLHEEFFSYKDKDTTVPNLLNLK